MKQKLALFGATLPLLAALIGTASAAVSIPAGGTTVNFATTPLSADWSSVSVGGGAGDLTVLGSVANGMDVATTGVSATLAWPGTPTTWTSIAAPAAQSLNAAMRHVTGTHIFTGPTGNRYSALVGRFQNNAGGTIESFALSWTLGSPFAPGGTGAVGTDPIAGLHVYFSKTGATGSWTLLSAPHGTPGVVGPTTLTIPAGLPLGSDLYIAWVDDNGPGGGTAPNLEGNFTVDDVTIGTVTLANASIAAAVSGVVRNDPSGTPTVPGDDTVTFTLTVTGSGAVSGSHRITTPVAIADGAPVANGARSITTAIGNFTGPGHTLTGAVEDSVNAAVNAPFTVTAPWGTITGSGSAFTYNDNGSPANAADDTAGYTASATGTFTGPSYTVDSVPTSGSPTSVAYGSSVTIPLPASATGPGVQHLLSYTDDVDPTITQTLSISPIAIIGTDTTSGSPLNVMSVGNAGSNTWTYNGATRTMTMVDGDRSGMGAAAKEVQSVSVSLAGVAGVVKFSMDMTATDTSSGFESPGDNFVAELFLHDGVSEQPAINLISASDTNANGVLNGSEIVGAPVAPATSATRTFNLVHFIPDSIQSARVVIRGITDSPSETMAVSNLRFEVAAPTLSATAGAVTVNNQGTVNPADDTMSAPVTIQGVNVVSAGWTSDGNPAAGLYTDAQPVIFTAPAASSPATVTISNASPALTAPITLTRPAITLVASGANLLRVDHGAGLADDTLTFDLTVSGTNGGPQFTLADPSGTVTTADFTLTGTPTVHAVTLAAPTHGTVVLTVADASYPGQVVNLLITVPPPVPVATQYILGQKNTGGGLSDLVSDAGTPTTTWHNYPGLRKTVNTNGGATAVALASEVIDLSTAGAIQFTATIRAVDRSAGFEAGDTLLVTLLIDGVTTVNLITPYDADASGVMNGGAGAADDEFNAAHLQDGTYTSTFALSHLIPASATSVQLIITGANDSANETFVIENVLFVPGGPVDTDGDGMDDAYEDANGLDKNSAADKFLDKDGDGQNNYAEYLAGTSANDPASKLDLVAVTLDGTTGAYNIQWTSVPGKNYRVRISSDLVVWNDAGTVPASAGATTTISGTFAGPVPDRIFVEIHVP